MQKLKKYFIGNALVSIYDDPFEKMKIELMFNLLLFWIPISILPIIPLIIDEYWIMIWSPFVTTIGSVLSLYFLRKTSSYKTPSYIFTGSCFIGLFIMHLVGGGTLRGVDVLWTILSFTFSFILLGKKLGFYSFLLCALLIIWSTLIFLGFVPAHLFKEFEDYQQLFRHPNIVSVIVPLTTIGYLLYSYLSAQEKAQKLLAVQKEKLYKKKIKIELVQKETEESIFYAKRIQTALLPSRKVIKRNLKNSFILYKPKDIVSGDFYWIQSKGNTIYFAVADCTGHGVPGAMVSVICMNALNRSIKEFEITDPAEILNKTRNLIISQFNKNSEEVKDGMDISFCALNTDNNKVYWAGANNPIWIIRHETNELEEIKPDRQPVGEHSFIKSFTTHIVQLNKNDMIYITTDGFLDQFGGKYGKKYRSLNLKNQLIELAKKPLNTQEQLLDIEFETWKGKLEQTDDVCVMGVRI